MPVATSITNFISAIAFNIFQNINKPKVHFFFKKDVLSSDLYFFGELVV
jgi:hypothetical protein